MSTFKNKMTALADAIRNKAGTTDALTLDEMSIAVERIETSGGGDVEFCTVEIVADAPVVRAYIRFLDENYTPQGRIYESMDIMMGISITVPKYRPVYCDEGIFTDAGEMSTGGIIKMNPYAFFVTDSGRFVIS